MKAFEATEGDVFTQLGNLEMAWSRDSKPKVPNMIVWEVNKRRSTGLIQFVLYPVGSKMIKSSRQVQTFNDKIITLTDEVPSGLEVWEIPRNFEVSKKGIIEVPETKVA